MLILSLLSVESIEASSMLTSLKLESNATTLNVEEQTTLTAMGTYSDNSTKAVNENVTYTITPANKAKVNGTILTALKDGNVTVQATVGGVTSNSVKLHITWVVNGHVLPPEPDPKVNNATLLGVDSNDNGVRDDVERYVIQTYKDEKIAIEIGVQVARAFNTVIENPANAEEVDKVLTAAQDCSIYFQGFADIFGEPLVLKKSIVTSKKFKSIMLNTKERIRAYLEYNRNLSGGVYEATKIKNMKSKCTFDVEEMLKDRK